MVYGRASLGRSVSQGGPVSRWAGERASGRAGGSLEVTSGAAGWWPHMGSGHLQSCHWGVRYGPAFAPPVPCCLSRELFPYNHCRHPDCCPLGIVLLCKQYLRVLHLCITSQITIHNSKLYSALPGARTLQRFVRNYSLWLHTFLFNLITYL